MLRNIKLIFVGLKCLELNLKMAKIGKNILIIADGNSLLRGVCIFYVLQPFMDTDESTWDEERSSKEKETRKDKDGKKEKKKDKGKKKKNKDKDKEKSKDKKERSKEKSERKKEKKEKRREREREKEQVSLYINYCYI